MCSSLFTASYFRELIGSEDAAPECTAACWFLIVVWLLMTGIGCYIQTVLLQLEHTRLVTERRRLADDAVFSTAFTYDTFSSSKTQQQQATPQMPPAPPLVASASFAGPSISKATYNFFDPARLPENLQPLFPVISRAFDGLSAQFGFQQGSVQNQSEHLLFLLGNIRSRGVSDAIARLHAKVFGNYLEWTAFLRVTAYCSSPETFPSLSLSPSSQQPQQQSQSSRAASSLKLQEVALWLCIWGEAGSLRHLPECLCYIYHSMGAELLLHRDGEGRHKPGVSIPHRKQGSFLSDVITPIFDVLRVEKGDTETNFRNYDDWNEFFWQQHCLGFYFAHHKYYVHWNDGGEAGAGGAGAGAGSSASSRLLSPGGRSSLPPSVSDGLTASSKTHLERRSWLHPCRSFMRIISFYFTVFHILVCIAYCRFRQWPLLGPDTNKAVSSFVISLAGWSIVKELLEIWGAVRHHRLLPCQQRRLRHAPRRQDSGLLLPAGILPVELRLVTGLLRRVPRRRLRVPRALPRAGAGADLPLAVAVACACAF